MATIPTTTMRSDTPTHRLHLAWYSLTVDVQRDVAATLQLATRRSDFRFTFQTVLPEPIQIVPDWKTADDLNEQWVSSQSSPAFQIDSVVFNQPRSEAGAYVPTAKWATQQSPPLRMKFRCCAGSVVMFTVSPEGRPYRCNDIGIVVGHDEFGPMVSLIQWDRSKRRWYRQKPIHVPDYLFMFSHRSDPRVMTRMRTSPFVPAQFISLSYLTDIHCPHVMVDITRQRVPVASRATGKPVYMPRRFPDSVIYSILRRVPSSCQIGVLGTPRDFMEHLPVAPHYATLRPLLERAGYFSREPPARSRRETT